jgi:hypothetical protein
MPRGYTATELGQRALYRRAIEAAIWGMPIVNYDLMYQAAKRLNADYNQIVYWSRLPDWKNQTLTPNPDAIYILPIYKTKDGPVVLEIPPAGDDGSITGSIDDCWQTAIEDIGPSGADKGSGGKYLILPPDYKDKIPDGYLPMPSSTYQGYVIARSILRSGSDADIAKAVAYGKRINLYPFSRVANPPATKYVDVIGHIFDSCITYDLRFYQSLARMVEYEPWLLRDKVMIDFLKTIGIEKGKPFNPDATTQEILKGAIQEAHEWMEAKYENVFSPFNEGAQWALPASPEVVDGMQTNFANPDHYPIDGRGITYSYAFFCAKHLGAGQFYLMALKDNKGRAFDGGQIYRLTVPPNVPVKQYWSATVYDRATHAMIRNMPRASRSSQNPDLKKNADGSVDVYFGSIAPAGKESNWVPTDPKGKFEVLFRLYGPEKALFDRTWKLPDIEDAAAELAGKAA